MSLEEKVRGTWDKAVTAAKTKQGFPEACRALCQLLNVPMTGFNERTILELVGKQEPVETFIKISDRYPPSFDTDTEPKFRAYVETYRRIRRDMGPDDVLAFLRVTPTAELRQRAGAWLEGKGPFDFAPPAKK
jgi:hypothetical protein